MMAPSRGGVVRELASVFLKLGLTAFGGPAAHTALVHAQVVERRAWIDAGRFLDLNSLTQLVPGPNSTELVMLIGYERARMRGLVVAGTCFIAPAFAIVLGLGWAYVAFGATPAAAGVFRAMAPVIVAIIAAAGIRLTRTALPHRTLAAIGCLSLAGFLMGVPVVPLMLAGGICALGAGRWVGSHTERRLTALLPAALTSLTGTAAGLPLFPDPSGGQLAELVWRFLKIGALLYGSGYALVAYLNQEFNRPGLLTADQVLDAVAVGQVTPGPLFTTATMVGYQIAGPLGAILATAAIFLPSFVIVALVAKHTGRLRDRPWLSDFLDGANAVSWALVVGAAARLGLALEAWQVVAACCSAALLMLTRINPTWLIGGAAVIGLMAPSQWLGIG